MDIDRKSSSAIEVCNLSIKYKHFLAVDDVSFSVLAGEVFGIIGPNGAGKTSTLECIEGLRKRSSGEIKIFGEDNYDKKKFYQNIGIQLQETKFPDNIKVIELLKLYSSFYENNNDYEKYLIEFGLDLHRNSFIKKLSGGQRQRLSIIIALIGNPRIVILDEISTGLDPVGRRQIWDLIKKLKKAGKTILLTTHFMEEAAVLCDRLCLMTNGKVKAIGTIEELVDSADIPITISLKVTDCVIETFRSFSNINFENGIIRITLKDKSLIFSEIEKIGRIAKIVDVSIYKPTLEDVFLKLTGSILENKI